MITLPSVYISFLAYAAVICLFGIAFILAHVDESGNYSAIALVAFCVLGPLITFTNGSLGDRADVAYIEKYTAKTTDEIASGIVTEWDSHGNYTIVSAGETLEFNGQVGLADSGEKVIINFRDYYDEKDRLIYREIINLEHFKNPA